MRRARGGFVVTLTADKLARAVQLSAVGLDGSFSDNYFDLPPGGQVEATFRAGPPATLEGFRRRLRVRSRADAFGPR